MITDLDCTDILGIDRSESRIARSDSVVGESLVEVLALLELDVEVQGGGDEVHVLGHMFREMVG